MRTQASMTRLDRPWHRPGATWYALRRLAALLHPPADVYEPPADTVSVLRDLPVVVRDGTTLRVNVVLPAGAGQFPVLLSAHPYGKDKLPERRGRGYRVPFQYRWLRQTGRVRFSSLTGWEAPDPAWWAPPYLTAAGLAAAPPSTDGHITFDNRSRGACWEWTTTAHTEITGPMALRLWVEAHDADDICLFAGVEKWRGHTYIPFEGSYGFGRDRITTGWLKASLRALDEHSSRPFDPVPAFTDRQPLAPGQIVQADLALGPSATVFKAGETLRLVVAGRWLWPRNPFTGQFPAAYEKTPGGKCTLHWGPRHQGRLLVPVIP
jgi:predicted acyl esterase